MLWLRLKSLHYVKIAILIKMNTLKKLVLILVCLFLSSAQANEFFRDDVQEVVIDKQGHRMWQDNIAARSTDLNFKDAISYCQSLDLAGHKDWYLPKLDELKSIVKAQNYPRSIAKAFKHVYPDYYWSSTEHSSEFSWIVLFIYEDSSYYHKSDPSYVRCVRKVH